MATIQQLATTTGTIQGEVKISELPVAAQANDSDMFEVSQQDPARLVSRSVTLGQIRTQVQASFGPGVLAWLATPNSANLAAAMIDETGTAGQLVFSQSPALTGDPTAPTATAGDNSFRLATTQFVTSAIAAIPLPPPPDLSNYVQRSGSVMTGPLALAGISTAPTAPQNTNTTQIASCEFVNIELGGQLQFFAPINSPAFTGTPTAPTIVTGSSTDQRIVNWATLSNQLGLILPSYAPINSPLFTGDPRAPTPAPGDNDTSIATTAFVAQAIAAGASIVVGDTPPVSPASNMLWWHSLLGQLFIYYNDGNSTQWVPASPAAGGLNLARADFFATNSSNFNPPNSPTVVTQFDTVLSGNSGNWFVPATGRFTPPAGRYTIFATLTYITGTSSGLGIALRKNGANVINSAASSGGGSQQNPAVVTAILDANGTDYFDIVANANVGGISPFSAWFGAFPIGITQVTVAPAGVFRLINRVAVSTAQPYVDFPNIPTDINDLMATFDVSPVTNDSNFALQMYNASGVLDAANGSYAGSTDGVNHTLSGAPVSGIGSATHAYTQGILFNYGATGNGVSNAAGAGIGGDLRIPAIRDATRQKKVNFAASYLNGNGNVYFSLHGGGVRQASGAITGLRFLFAPGNIAAGTIALWGSP